MRGKGTSLRNFKSDERITPAYAGKSFQLGDVPAVQKDHPRLCGEKRRSEFLHTIPAGSPPPMRGKGTSCSGVAFISRITPAYAGKRHAYYKGISKPKDHPRLCGEKKHRVFQKDQTAGITPAYAGKSRSNFHHQKCNKDHPRLCGEKVILNRFTAFTIGSPPPMRGKVVHSQLRVIVFRITPAYAGKRQRKHVRHAKPWDHPRLCGEKTVKSHRACQAVGSPPPMRGKDRQHVLQGRLW